MNLKKILGTKKTRTNLKNKLNKYILKPIITASIIGTIGTQSIKAQNNPEADTIYAYGQIAVSDINQHLIEGAHIYAKPLEMAMVVPDTTYEYTTDINGGAGFDNLPVYIDSTTGIKNKKNKKNNELKVFPNPSKEFNFNSKEKLEEIIIYDMTGKKIKTTKPNNKHAYIKLEKTPNGTYIYQAKTKTKTITGKIIKNNKQAQEKTTNQTTNNYKTSKELNYEALYQFITTAEGYYNDTTTQTIKSGEYNIVDIILNPLPPGTITINNIARDLNTKQPLDSIIARVYIADTLFQADTTGTDGIFTFTGLPQNTELKVEIGGRNDYYAFKDIVNYTTPGNITINTDSTLNDSIYNALIPKKSDYPNITTAQHIVSMTGNGSINDTIIYKFIANVNGTTFNNNEKGLLRNYINQSMNEEDNTRVFIEETTNTKPATWTIAPGAYTTHCDYTTYQTHFGTLYPEITARTTTDASNKNAFIHEEKRGYDLQQISYDPNSIMYTFANGYTEEDKDISKLDKRYWDGVYRQGYTQITLELIADSIPSNVTTTYKPNKQYNNKEKQ